MLAAILELLEKAKNICDINILAVFNAQLNFLKK